MSTTSFTVEASATDAETFSCDALFFGDSITCDGNFDELFPSLRVVNLGVYGDTLGDLRRRVPEVKAENPARIFLLGGINSLSPDGVAECLDQYRDLVEALASACPKAELVIQSVLPVAAELDPQGSQNQAVRRFNAGLKSLAEEKDLAFVDLYAVYEINGALDPGLTRDGLHLNFNAYGPWTEALKPWIGE